ncbi:hypothetical protein F4777DRAFT_552533 [Nemania sp. FL0916]|nr:hypothetical protein F4777DRAFT_552533 [Nemania sp. FL0916]
MQRTASIVSGLLLLAVAVVQAAPQQTNADRIPRATDAPEPDATDAALEPWVTVQDDGTPSTVTPVLTTISGTPTVLSGAPHDVTATVFTYTSYGKVITSTGTTPPEPTATHDAAGSFALCNNEDGPLAPWCRPDGEDPLYVGTTYYFTWDPQYFNSSRNSTVQVVGNHINSTTGEVRTDSPAFMSSLTPAGFGYVSIAITDQQLLYQGSQNISCMLVAVVGGQRVQKQGPVITITKRPGPVADAKGKLPQGAALYIALPTVFGFIALCLIGTCLWNRHHRRIVIPSVMGRNYEVGKSKRSRFGLGRKRTKAAKASERIQLMEREIRAEGGEVYRDLPDPADRPRRDSDALGSLAGTPTEDRRMELGHPGGENARSRSRSPAPVTGNAFRDELQRQERERS